MMKGACLETLILEENRPELGLGSLVLNALSPGPGDPRLGR